jgi:hypothetical protein
MFCRFNHVISGWSARPAPLLPHSEACWTWLAYMRFS